MCCESRDVLRFSQVHGLFLGAEHVGRGSSYTDYRKLGYSNATVEIRLVLKADV